MNPLCQTYFSFLLFLHKNYLQSLTVLDLDFSLALLVFLLVLITSPLILLCSQFILIYKKTRKLSGFCLLIFGSYLTPILVAGASPFKRSRIEYFAEPIITEVPCLTASLMYSNFALAPFAPALEAPWQ